MNRLTYEQHNPDFRRLSILYEDASVAVVYKPAGLLSVSYPGNTAKTALDVLCDMMRKRGRVSGRARPAVVHRLDRDTSGVMVFALTASVKGRMMDNWNQLVTERRYRALAENPEQRRAQNVVNPQRGSRTGGSKPSGGSAPVYVLPDSGIIDAPLSFNAQHRAYVAKEDFRRAGNSRAGKSAGAASRYADSPLPAVTHYTVVKRGSRYTLFELELETGRKNQIRAHLASAGYVIAGDGSYRAKTDPFNRLCLHARSLAFIHPVTHEPLRFEIPEPPEWEQFC